GHVGIEPANYRGGAFGFRLTNVGCAVNNLALEVRERNRIIVDDRNIPDARRREIKQRGRAEPAGADDEDARALERRLPGAAHFAQHDVARVTLQFVRSEHCKQISGSRIWGAASPRTRPCLPSDRRSRTTNGTRAARTACLRRAWSRTRG